MLSCHIEPVASHEDNTVHPDTILRQMILHEIHSDGMGPDWEYQDSLELLLGRCSAFLFEITSPIICQQLTAILILALIVKLLLIQSLVFTIVHLIVF
jgi:hypothetical protein